MLRNITFEKIRFFIYFIILFFGVGFLLRRGYINKIPILGDIEQAYCVLTLPKMTPLTQAQAYVKYDISDVDNKKLYENIQDIVGKNKYEPYKKFFNSIQKYSPEGFYVINGFYKRQPNEFKIALLNWIKKFNTEEAAILVHEFTHAAQAPCFLKAPYCALDKNFKVDISNGWDDIHAFSYDMDKEFWDKSGYWTDTKAFIIDYDERPLFSFYQTEIPPYKIETLTPLDKRDNDEDAYGNQDFPIMLGEVNAYTKSSRIIRQLNCSSIPKRLDTFFYAQGLARMLVHLATYINYSKNEYKSSYNSLVNNKSLAYLTMRLEALAKEEINLVLRNAKSQLKINHETSEEGIRFNLKLLESRHGSLEQFYDDAGVKNLNRPLTEEELKKNDIKAEIISIN